MSSLLTVEFISAFLHGLPLPLFVWGIGIHIGMGSPLAPHEGTHAGISDGNQSFPPLDEPALPDLPHFPPLDIRLLILPLLLLQSAAGWDPPPHTGFSDTNPYLDGEWVGSVGVIKMGDSVGCNSCREGENKTTWLLNQRVNCSDISVMD